MRYRALYSAATACAAATIADAASAEQWRGRAIYQILTDRFARTDSNINAICNPSERTYCGGTWRGIINQLDYIKNMGFTAIWISPVTHNIPGNSAYHGYWQQDLYSLNEHFGTADDLKDLSKAVHDRGMYLMVDVVTNHFGWPGAANTVDYSKFFPFNDAKYFHSYCPISDYSNQEMVENCWLGDSNVELPDLKTEDSTVSNMYNTWIRQLVSNYSIDGLRIDTVKHVGKPFWSSFQSAAGVYAMGEVLSGTPSFTCSYQPSLNGLLNYPLYYPLIQFFNSTAGSAANLLYNMAQIKSSCTDLSLLGTFTENHDLPRLASQTDDLALAKNAIAATILWDGIPIIYAGQEQHYNGNGDPFNREATWLSRYNRQSDLYKFVSAINQVRNHIVSLDSGYLTYNIYSVYNDTNTVALRKGYDGKQIISIITNGGTQARGSTLKLKNHGWSAGTQVVEVVSCLRGTVASDGTLNVPMQAGMPKVYIASTALGSSAICK